MQERDYSNLFSLIGFASATSSEQQEDQLFLDRAILAPRLNHFLDTIEIQQLKTRPGGWGIPKRLLPEEATWHVCAVLRNEDVIKVIIPLKAKNCAQLLQKLEEQGMKAVVGQLALHNGQLSLQLANGTKNVLPDYFRLNLEGEASFAAALDRASIGRAKRSEDILFDVEIPLQDQTLKGKVPYRGLEIAKVVQVSKKEGSSPLWIYKATGDDDNVTYILPNDRYHGEGVALPKSFRDAGVLIGDRGFLSYYSPTASIVQEQQIPIYVAGFYDPGIIPIGGKYILANQEVTALIRASISKMTRLPSPMESTSDLTNCPRRMQLKFS